MNEALVWLFRISLLVFPSLFICTSQAWASDSRIVAAQVFYSPAESLSQLSQEIAEMKSRGINTIIFRVFGNKGDRIYPFARPNGTEGVYFRTSNAPVIDDILGEVVKISHLHGLKIFAWMTTRYATYGTSSSMFDREFDLASERERTIPKLDLFNPESIKHLEALFRDLAAYPIDGVLFQDDLLIKHMEGISPYAKAVYLRAFNRLLNPTAMYTELFLKEDGRVARVSYTEEFWRWAQLKNRRLIEASRGLIGTLKAENPGIKTCFNSTYELYRNPRNALAWQSHTIELAKEFDLVAIMAYHRQMASELGVDGKQVKEIIKKVTENAIKLHGAERVILKTQTIDWKSRTPIPDDEVMESYRAIESVSGNVGVAFAPWEGDIKISIP
jgi:biofilm PGA synthesis lipoprotein PgaB